jgi:tRNA pseudouridine55 synthase
MLDGFLLIDKPAGPTSHDIVNIVRKWSGQRRVGHTGTLDPAATGLLVMVLGQATRLSQWMTRAEKEYEGAALFGIGTATLDAMGRETDRFPCDFSAAELKKAAADMLGDSIQVPPKYSAVKIKGKPAYAWARQGLEPQLAGRPITIKSFSITMTGQGKFPTAEFKLVCSSGTYVRSVIADLGAALNCPAHLTALRRIRVGRFNLDEAVTVPELTQLSLEGAGKILLPLRAGLDMPEVVIEEEDMALLLNGRAVRSAGPKPPGSPGEIVKIIGPHHDELLGLGKIQDDRVKPFTVIKGA